MPRKNTIGKDCPQCGSKMRGVLVEIEDADSPVKSHQCGKCGYFDFEKKSIRKAIDEIKAKEMALKLRQRIIKLSHGRLGMYINRDVARSLNLKGGEEIYVSLPDKKHILISVSS